MSSNESTDTTCAVCEKDLTTATGVAHIYQEGRRFALCCPLCVQLFQRAPARFAGGDRPQTIVEELVAELKWKDSGRL